MCLENHLQHECFLWRFLNLKTNLANSIFYSGYTISRSSILFSIWVDSDDQIFYMTKELRLSVSVLHRRKMIKTCSISPLLQLSLRLWNNVLLQYFQVCSYRNADFQAGSWDSYLAQCLINDEIFSLACGVKTVGWCTFQKGELLMKHTFLRQKHTVWHISFYQEFIFLLNTTDPPFVYVVLYIGYLSNSYLTTFLKELMKLVEIKKQWCPSFDCLTYSDHTDFHGTTENLGNLSKLYKG